MEDALAIGIAMIRLRNFCAANDLWFYLQTCTNGFYTLEVQGAGEGEFFVQKNRVFLTHAVNYIIEDAEKYWSSLKNGTE